MIRFGTREEKGELVSLLYNLKSKRNNKRKILGVEIITDHFLSTLKIIAHVFR